MCLPFGQKHGVIIQFLLSPIRNALLRWWGFSLSMSLLVQTLSLVLPLTKNDCHAPLPHPLKIGSPDSGGCVMFTTKYIIVDSFWRLQSCNCDKSGLHTKFENPRITHFERKVAGAERRRKNAVISGHFVLLVTMAKSNLHNLPWLMSNYVKPWWWNKFSMSTDKTN